MKPKFHLLRHVTARHMTCRASRDVTCRACCAVRTTKKQ